MCHCGADITHAVPTAFEVPGREGLAKVSDWRSGSLMADGRCAEGSELATHSQMTRKSSGFLLRKSGGICLFVRDLGDGGRYRD